MATTNIEDNYVLTNYSSSVDERRQRDPSNDAAGVKAEGTIVIMASSTGDLDGGTVTITNHVGLQKVYIFDDDSDGNTGTLDGSSRVRVQISGFDKSAHATQLKTAITHANGHGSTITILGPDEDSSGDGKLYLTQSVAGDSGNVDITSDINAGFLEPNGFESGSTGAIAFKDATVAPFILSTRSTQNLRGQTVSARYRTFLGEDRT
tara:strand:- start:2269 stop:2889 length:621 start_codon:yes stop_codon:yes gene_type:complete